MWKLSANSPHMASLPFNNYFNTYYYNPKKFVTDTNSSKSSFTIEAILGINNHQNNHKNLLIVDDNNDYELNDLKLKNCICSDLSPKRSNYINLHNVASVSPDSTAKEQNFSRYQSKNKISSTSATNLHLSTKRSIDSVEITDAIRESKFSKSANKMDVGTRLAQSVASHASHAAHAKSKRVRTIFTPEQLERLETEFERQQYMVGPERLLLASALSLSEAQVKVWFQNRRIKWRKQHLEQQHARFSNLRQASNEAADDITSDEEGEHDNLSVEESGIGSSTAIDNINHFIC